MCNFFLDSPYRYTLRSLRLKQSVSREIASFLSMTMVWRLVIT